MMPASKGKRASTKRLKKLPAGACPFCAAISQPSCILYSVYVPPDVCVALDALIGELFETKVLLSKVFKACMTLQGKNIKPKAQSEVLLQHALVNEHPDALIAKLAPLATSAFEQASHSHNASEQPSRNATPLAWYFQQMLRRHWSRYYAKQSSEKNIAEQEMLRSQRRRDTANAGLASAVGIYSRRLVATAAKLQTPPADLAGTLSTFALCQRSGRLRKLSASSPAPVLANDFSNDFDWLNTVFEFDPLDGPGNAGGVVPGEAQLSDSLGDQNTGFVSGNTDGGFQLPDLDF